MADSRPKRYAAGRARALGIATRGTTNPNRLRRIDRHLVAVHAERLRRAAVPLVVDLGYGATPVTAVELRARLVGVRADVEVVGVELDPARVAAAQHAAGPGLRFARGGFEVAGLQPTVVRCLNVLRQYPEADAASAWATICATLQSDGVLLEGTCDEIGRRASWVTLGPEGPRSLTLAAHVATLSRPSDLAERLPKALIHHNVPGRRVHDLLRALDHAWDRSAFLAPFGARQRWIGMGQALDWEQTPRQRWRDGEVTVPWSSVAD